MVGDDAQTGSGIQELAVDAIAEHREQRRHLAHAAQQLAALERLLGVVLIDLDARSQHAVRRERQPAGDQDARLLHRPSLSRAS